MSVVDGTGEMVRLQRGFKGDALKSTSRVKPARCMRENEIGSAVIHRQLFENLAEGCEAARLLAANTHLWKKHLTGWR